MASGPVNSLLLPPQSPLKGLVSLLTLKMITCRPPAFPAHPGTERQKYIDSNLSEDIQQALL
ncbi:MAG: hypothetical protein AB7F82_09200, partial [Alphaproteobacteria bacterium]